MIDTYLTVHVLSYISLHDNLVTIKMLGKQFNALDRTAIRECLQRLEDWECIEFEGETSFRTTGRGDQFIGALKELFCTKH